MSRPNLHATNAERGISLFEVLITVVVVSIGLLGLAGLQFAGLRAANSAQEHTLATLLAQDIEERVRANSAGAASGAYNNVTIDASSSYTTAVDCFTVSCSSAQIVNFDLNQWYRFLYPNPGEKPLLPTAAITINSTNSLDFQITIQWGDPSGPQTLNSTFTRS
jgi:type IV pilus assembly protein PilV